MRVQKYKDLLKRGNDGIRNVDCLNKFNTLKGESFYLSQLKAVTLHAETKERYLLEDEEVPVCPAIAGFNADRMQGWQNICD